MHQRTGSWSRGCLASDRMMTVSTGAGIAGFRDLGSGAASVMCFTSTETVLAAPNGCVTGQHLVEQASEAVHVNGVICRLPVGLFGGIVGRRTYRSSGLEQVKTGPCQTPWLKICQKQALRRNHEDVARLDVCVHQSFTMGVFECTGQLVDDLYRPAEALWPPQPRLQRGMLQLAASRRTEHRRQARNRRPARRLGVQSCAIADMSSVKRGAIAGWARNCLAIDLDRNRALRLLLHGLVDNSQWPSGDLTSDPVCVSYGSVYHAEFGAFHRQSYWAGPLGLTVLSLKSLVNCRSISVFGS